MYNSKTTLLILLFPQLFIYVLGVTVLGSELLTRFRNLILSVDLNQFGPVFLNLARQVGVMVTDNTTMRVNDTLMVINGVQDVIQGSLLGLAGTLRLVETTATITTTTIITRTITAITTVTVTVATPTPTPTTTTTAKKVI